MILKARALLTMDGPPIERGAVAIEGARIVAAGPLEAVRAAAGESEEVELGETVLLPGLINAHCHLDYTTLRHAISPPRSFTAWVRRINAIKRTLTSDDYLEAIRRGFAELARWGTTTVCNVEAFPELMPQLAEPPLRTWWFYEMIDIRHRVATEEVVRGALAFFGSAPDSLNRFGLSPHAPYTASRMLYGQAQTCADDQMLLTTHVAESREEREMFCAARGPLYEFMRDLGRPMEDCGHGSSFSGLWRSGAIDERWLLVHMNELTEEDFALLETLPAERRPHVVHCPGSHEYFGHSPFPWQRLAALGVNLCLGTDSLASTHSLSLFDEMRSLQAREPALTAEELLRAVTTAPARALREAHQLGVLRAGARADLIALPLTDSVATVYDQVVNFRSVVPWVMIDGQIRTS